MDFTNAIIFQLLDVVDRVGETLHGIDNLNILAQTYLNKLLNANHKYSRFLINMIVNAAYINIRLWAYPDSNARITAIGMLMCIGTHQVALTESLGTKT